MATVLRSAHSPSSVESHLQVSSKPTTPSSSSSQDNHAASRALDADPITSKPTHWNDQHNALNPFNWPDAKKWRVTLLACFMTFVIQLNGTMMTSAAEQINSSFHVSDEDFPHSYWPVLSWNLGGAAAPLLGLPYMENFGVRRSYMVRSWKGGCGGGETCAYSAFPGYSRCSNRLYRPSSRSEELRDYDCHAHHYRGVFGDFGEHHVWHRK
jgi:hypothetical protein